MLVLGGSLKNNSGCMTIFIITRTEVVKDASSRVGVSSLLLGNVLDFYHFLSFAFWKHSVRIVVFTIEKTKSKEGFKYDPLKKDYK